MQVTNTATVSRCVDTRQISCTLSTLTVPSIPDVLQYSFQTRRKGYQTRLGTEGNELVPFVSPLHLVYTTITRLEASHTAEAFS